MKTSALWIFAVVIGGSVCLGGCSNPPATPAVFNGSSDELKQTAVVATLETPIPEGKNAIWCASFPVAGQCGCGIVQTIRDGLAKQFPHKAAPSFPQVESGDLLSYAYLETNAKFTHPYYQNHKPVGFTSSDGTTTQLSSFGLCFRDNPSGRHIDERVEKQAAVLFPKFKFPESAEEKDCNAKGALEFAIDLDPHSEIQVVVAAVKRRGTLAAM